MMRFFSIVVFCFVFLTSQISVADELEIVNIRVGQGDATLIQGPAKGDGTRVNVLFDAGNISKRDGGNIIRAILSKRKVKILDYLIISHDDADHLGGVAFGGHHGVSFLLGYNNVPGNPGDDDGNGISDWLPGKPDYRPDPAEIGTGDDIAVKNFVDYGDHLMRKTVAIRKYQQFAKSMGRRITLNDQTHVDSFEIDLGLGAKMILMAANGYVRGRAEPVQNVDHPNERSLSFLVHYDKFDFLISGDMIGRGTSDRTNGHVEESVGHAIVAAGYQVDILHVNHHGADNASSAAFLDLIKPEIAIISAGNKNGFDHPRNNVLQRLIDAGVDRIIQTSWGTTRDRIPHDIRDHQAIWQQDIIIRSNGQHFWVETSRRWKAK